MTEPDRVLVVVGEWIRKAENDFKAANHLLKIERDNPTDTVCFHAQQCVEKYVKSLLVWKEIDFPKTHDLAVLAGMLPEDLRPSLAPQEERRLVEYGTITRYPGVYEPISLDEAKAAVRLARRVRTEARERLPKSVLRSRAS